MTYRRGTSYALHEPGYVGMTTYLCVWCRRCIQVPAARYIGEVAGWDIPPVEVFSVRGPVKVHRDMDLCSPACLEAWRRECQPALVAKFKEVYGVSYDASSVYSHCR